MNFNGVILIGDASEKEESEKNRDAVRHFQKNLEILHYQHPPQVSLIEGTNLLLSEAKTTYSVFAGDDDFLVPEVLSRCVAFLEQNLDYSCACGEQVYCFIRKKLDGGYGIEKVIAGYSKNHEEELPSQRMVQYCNPARANNTFSVQRTVNMREGWRKASELGLDKGRHHSPLHEVAVNVVSLIQGKQSKFPQLYHVMLRHQEREGGGRSFQGDVRWLERMCSWDWSDEVKKLFEWWQAELARKENIDPDMAGDIAESVFLACWIPTMLRRRGELLSVNDRLPKYPKNSKEYFLQQIKKLRRHLPQKIPSTDSPDFQAIREVVECP